MKTFPKNIPVFSGCFCVYGYGAEYSGDQNGFGMAMAVAALIDAMHLHEIVGCIAGDDHNVCSAKRR